MKNKEITNVFLVELKCEYDSILLYIASTENKAKDFVEHYSKKHEIKLGYWKKDQRGTFMKYGSEEFLITAKEVDAEFD